MEKRVILVTGTPCVGKTTFARKLAERLSAHYVNLTELAEREHLTLGRDKERDTAIIDEHKMRLKLRSIITKTENPNVIIDGHYAAAVTSKKAVTHVFVLRRNPVELRAFMQKCGFNPRKQSENLAAEILDVCLVEALREQQLAKVCELDVSGKSVDDTLSEALAVLEDRVKCGVGCVDWLGMLEREGKLDEYLK
jgi:adenylate kinase